jgi:hypothetical protein
MATKTTTSSTTTTKTLLQEPLGGKSVYRYDNVTTTEQRKRTLKEKAEGGLSSIVRFEMIAITLLVIGIGTAVDDFGIEDLVETNPNYNVNNTYIPIDDPLNNVNYLQYGDEVFDRIFNEQTGFMALLSDVTDTATNVTECLSDIPSCIGNIFFKNEEDINELITPLPDTFTDTFGSDRIFYLRAYYVLGGRTPYDLYQQLTTEEKEFIEDYTGEYMESEKTFMFDWSPSKFYFFGFNNPFNDDIWQWGYFAWPNLIDTVDLLGV